MKATKTLTSLILLIAVSSLSAVTFAHDLDQNTLKQIDIWRTSLLNKGGAGLYQTVNKSALAERAKLPADYATLLKKLDKLIVVDKPNRARIYRVAQNEKHHWVARLDYPNQRIAFLRLFINDQFELIDWYDEGLGVSLSQLLNDAAHLYQRDSKQFNRFLKALSRSPISAIQQLPNNSSLARLAIAACKDKCYDQALEQLEPNPDEISLFVIEKAIQNQAFDDAQTPLNQLASVLNGDPAFAWYQAAYLLNSQQFEQCVEIANEAIEKWAGEQRLYAVAAQCYLSLNQPANAYQTLKAMEQGGHLIINWQALLKDPDYQGLKQWFEATKDKPQSDYNR